MCEPQVDVTTGVRHVETFARVGKRVPTLQITGERCVPEAMPLGDRQSVACSRILTEHLARYWWANDRLATQGSNLVVVDAPCGAGYGCSILSTLSNVAIVVGIDVDSETVEYARDRSGIPGRVMFSKADLAAVRTLSDAMVCFEGIEHVGDQQAAAHAMCRALKPGGLLLVSTPRPGGPVSGSMFHARELCLEHFVRLFAPYLSKLTVYGQDVGVGDTSPEFARYFVLEGDK